MAVKGKERARATASQRGATAAEQQQLADAVDAAAKDDKVAWAAGQPMPKEDMPDLMAAPEMGPQPEMSAKPAAQGALMDFVLNPSGSDDEDIEEDYSSSSDEE